MLEISRDTRPSVVSQCVILLVVLAFPVLRGLLLANERILERVTIAFQRLDFVFRRRKLVDRPLVLIFFELQLCAGLLK